MNPEDFPDPESALIWSLERLQIAADQRRAAWRWPVLCTAAPAGRVLVLRAFDRTSRLIRLYTDRRSSKVAEIKADPRVELVFFDPVNMVQLRVAGEAALRTSGSDWQAALDALPGRAQRDYTSRDAPGAPIDHPDADLIADLTPETFAILEIPADRIKWLGIGRESHRAMQAHWTGESYDCQWITP